MLLHQLPYNVSSIRWIGVALFVLNIFLFIVSLILSIYRCVLRPRVLLAITRDSVQALALPIFPMAFATLINMTIYVCVPLWGPWIVVFVWALWWLDAVLAFLTCTLLAFQMCVSPNSYHIAQMFFL
jgi:tellurite resistance protein TehA-like permease